MLEVPPGLFSLHVMKYREREELKQELFDISADCTDKRSWTVPRT